ncbi:MAG: polymer-forming cytoskeletal protein [Bacteroidota bacterium]
MFRTNVKSKNEKGALQSKEVLQTSAESCFIAAGTVIEGKFYTKEDIRLDGRIIGDVISEKRLVMGDSGKIDGTANCTGSSISGKIEGELSVDGTLHLSASAYVSGKIKAKKFVVDEGASYNGECLIGEQHFK